MPNRPLVSVFHELRQILSKGQSRFLRRKCRGTQPRLTGGPGAFGEVRDCTLEIQGSTPDAGRCLHEQHQNRKAALRRTREDGGQGREGAEGELLEWESVLRCHPLGS